jgi:hypothetical protein
MLMTRTEALGPTTVISLEGEARSATERALRWAWRLALGVLFALLVGLAMLVAYVEPYRPNSTFGYSLGVIGGLLMLSQLVYPLRKRIPAIARFGLMERWLKYHIAAGILGPVLILFHATFKTGSTNATVALYAMLLVVASGIVGRFFYRRVHRGMSGRHLTLADVSTDLQASVASVSSVFALRPDIEPRLMAFYRHALATDLPPIRRLWRFMTLRLRARRLSLEIRHDAKSALRRQRKLHKATKPELMLSYRLAKGQINRFLMAVVQAAQFRGWERLFSLWHIVHLPFLYLLVFSGIVHVVAVHMY